MNTVARFSNRVDDYARYRPGYPAAIVEALARRFGLRPEHHVADVGSGTGMLAEVFLNNGNVVYAVEPNAAMRAAAEHALAAFAGFRSVDGTAEATTLPDWCVEWVAAGQAFHWFDPERCRVEFIRIMKPGGRVMLVWNNRREDTPFLADYERFTRTCGTDYAAVRHEDAETDGRIGRFFGGAFDVLSFDNEQVLDFEGLVGRTASASYMPGRDHPGYAGMIAELTRLFEEHQHDGTVTMGYETRAFVGRLD